MHVMKCPEGIPQLGDNFNCDCLQDLLDEEHKHTWLYNVYLIKCLKMCTKIILHLPLLIFQQLCMH